MRVQYLYSRVSITRISKEIKRNSTYQCIFSVKYLKHNLKSLKGQENNLSYRDLIYCNRKRILKYNIYIFYILRLCLIIYIILSSLNCFCPHKNVIKDRFSLSLVIQMEPAPLQLQVDML